MKEVSRFEANLLRIVHAILKQAPASQALPLLRRLPRPPCLRRNAVLLVQDALAKGMPLYLARAGGWRHERFLRQGQVRDGRLWERTPPLELGLAFSTASLEYLICLVSKDETPAAAAAGPADELLFVLGFEIVPQSESWPCYRRSALFHLLFPDRAADDAVDWAPWFEGGGAHILEALQQRLTERCLELERSKATLKDAHVMSLLGQRQAAALHGFLDAAHWAGRWDLARFLLEAGQELLADNPDASRWTSALDVAHLRLADRLETYRAALAFLTAFAQLAEWQQEARGIGYFDDGYAAAQLWKSDWERLGGDEVCRRAAAVLRSIEPLAS